MRLIDADKLIEKLRDFKEWENDDGRPIHTMTEIQRIDRCINFAQAEPTAFDADNHTCNCQHNNNSRDSEPCCRCDSRQTNADRIRNMSDEELAEWISVKNTCEQCAYEPECVCMKVPCTNGILKWLQSEAE